MTETQLSRAARYRAGKALRLKSPRGAHAKLHGAMTRGPAAILAQSDPARVPALVPERYKRMLASPFAFLRGAAALMAQDLAQQPIAGIPVQACGDCHLMNFGAFVTPEDNILFDINDFDETLPGVDFTADLKRLAASVAVGARAAKLGRKSARALAAACGRAYRLRMHELALLSPLEIWHARVDLEEQLPAFSSAALRRKLRKIIARARGESLERDDNFPNLVKGNKPVIADKPPAIYHFDPKAPAREKFDAGALFAAYTQSLPPERADILSRYTLRDTAFKAVGVGSVGTFCAVGLFMDGEGSPLFLQVKEAVPSVLERLGVASWSGHQGQRVVLGQRMLQASSDIFLGWTQDKASGRRFYVRILKNRRLGEISEIGEEDALADYAALCGRTLARAHARAGDAAMISGYLGGSREFDSALADFSMAYAEQNDTDYAALVKSRAAPAATKAKRKPAAKKAAPKTKAPRKAPPRKRA